MVLQEKLLYPSVWRCTTNKVKSVMTMTINFKTIAVKLKELFGKQHGFTLIEVLVSVVILTMLAIAFAKFSIETLKVVDFNKQQQEAFQLARQEAIYLSNIDTTPAPSNPTQVNGVEFDFSPDPPTTNTMTININNYSIPITQNLINVEWPSNGSSTTNSSGISVYTP